MIGWENNQGAYFVQKLQDEISSAETSIEGNATNIGTMSSLTTTHKDNLVNAINDVNSEVGTLSDLTTEAKTDTVSAINELNSNKQATITATDTTVGSVYANATVLSNKVRKYGKIVTINFCLYLTAEASATGETTIGVVPANYRPIEAVYSPAGYSGSPSACYCNIGTNGNIIVPATLINAKGVIAVNAVYMVE